jgi:hypothetical protein
MKKMIRMASAGVMMCLIAFSGFAQKIDNERLKRDIAVAENVLSTLLRQATTTGRTAYYFGEVKGNYMTGYGVIFNVPFNEWSFIAGDATTINRNGQGYVITWDSQPRVAVARGNNNQEEKETRLKTLSEASVDSLRTVAKNNYLEAMKTFLADYGDMISQLGPNEKIMVTNRGNSNNWEYGVRRQRTMLSAEISKADLTLFKQGKLNREQVLSKIKVVNTESAEEVEKDLELLASILGRLYRSDLSKSYYQDGNLYYERLSNYGVIYYMQVYSSSRDADDTHIMPTLNLRDLSQEERDEKVKEMYPAFEKDLRENLLEYGRTIRSLKPEEMIMVQVILTKCEGCKIPATLELTVKAGVLQDYTAGKISKDVALAAITSKKGPDQ